MLNDIIHVSFISSSSILIPLFPSCARYLIHPSIDSGLYLSYSFPFSSLNFPSLWFSLACKKMRTNKQTKPHIAYLLIVFVDLRSLILNIVRGIQNQRPRQPVHSTLLAQNSALGGLIVTNILVFFSVFSFLLRFFLVGRWMGRKEVAEQIVHTI